MEGLPWVGSTLVPKPLCHLKNSSIIGVQCGAGMMLELLFSLLLHCDRYNILPGEPWILCMNIKFCVKSKCQWSAATLNAVELEHCTSSRVVTYRLCCGDMAKDNSLNWSSMSEIWFDLFGLLCTNREVVIFYLCDKCNFHLDLAILCCWKN